MSALFVIVMTIIAFSVITKLKIKSNSLMNKYVTADCNKLEQHYSDHEILEVTAFHYKNQIAVMNGEATGYSPGVGAVKCFCENPKNEAKIGKWF